MLYGCLKFLFRKLMLLWSYFIICSPITVYMCICMHASVHIWICACMHVVRMHACFMLEIRFQRPWDRILHSAEEDNLSPFDSKIACLCQSIEIKNNTHVYRQSQMRKPTGSGVQWAERSLIIGTGYWVQVFSLILDSSVGLSAGIQSAGDLVPEALG